MQRGAPCHTVPLDSIAVSLQGALSARSLLAQSGPLEYAEEALHWWSQVFFFLQMLQPLLPDENDQIGRQMWPSKKGVEIFDWVLRRQILIGSKWMVDRQTDAQIWPALIRQPSQRKGQNTYICKYKYKYKCSNRGLAYKVPIWGCVKSGGVGFCPNRAANLFTTSSCSPGKSPSPFSGFARARFSVCFPSLASSYSALWKFPVRSENSF